MAAKKKTTKKKAAKKTATRKPVATRRPADKAALEESLQKIEGRLAALEAQPDTGREMRELRLALLPALQMYRSSARTRKERGFAMPYVHGGSIAIILIVVGVMGTSGTLSPDATAILLTGTLVYAFLSFRDYLLG